MPDHRQVERLVLQVQRDLAAQTNLRTLLAHANATVAGHRRDLRDLKARIKQGSTPGPGRTR